MVHTNLVWMLENFFFLLLLKGVASDIFGGLISNPKSLKDEMSLLTLSCIVAKSEAKSIALT